MKNEINTTERQLASALVQALDHLNWIGWGDAYERECSRDIRSEIERTGVIAHKILDYEISQTESGSTSN